MPILAILATAWALPPTNTVNLFEVVADGKQLERLDLSGDGRLVVGRERGGQVGFVLDVERWTVSTFNDCAVSGATVIDLADGSYEIWMSCDDGSLRARTYDGLNFAALSGDDGSAFVVNVTTGQALVGVYYVAPNSDSDVPRLYAIEAGESGTAVASVHAYDPFDNLLDAATLSGYPVNLVFAQFNEGVIVDRQLIVSHGSRNISSMPVQQANAFAKKPSFTLFYDCDDVAANPFGGIYCVDSSGTVITYNPAASQVFPVNLGTLVSPLAVCVNDDLSDGWLAVTGQQVKVWSMDENGAISEEPVFTGPEDADNEIQDMVTRDGYLFGGGVAGNLHIVTSRPWVYPNRLVAEPTSGTSGDVIQIKVVVDEDASVELRRGGNRFGGGKLLDSFDVVQDEAYVAELTLDADYAEGTNYIYAIATNADGLTGHALAEITVDNPPSKPSLNAGSLEFADKALELSFPGIPDQDLDHYEIYVSQTPFDGNDWPDEGGPKYDGATRLKTPIVVSAIGGDRVTQRIAPLENDVSYYVGVRAVDQGGKVGLMSAVVSGTPRPSYGAAELAGDEGGTPCSTAPTSAAGSLGLLGLVSALRRRRVIARRSVGAGAGLMVVSLLSADASAADDPWWKGDMSPAHANFEARYGFLTPADPNIRDVYDETQSNLLQIELGPQFWRVVEIDGGFGLYQELAHTVDAGGNSSGDRTMMTWFPLTLDGTLRLHILDEQPVVPFARFGYDYVVWSEKQDDGLGGKTTTRGAKFGQHWALGGNFLLDLMQRRRASMLEARTGINDSWLTVEWRRQRVDGRDRPWQAAKEKGLSFDADAILIGLKLDY